jgi:hypothetical protein
LTGEGLGLAIVCDLVEALPRLARAKGSDLGGLRATRELPAAAPTGSGPAIEFPVPVGR